MGKEEMVALASSLNRREVLNILHISGLHILDYRELMQWAKKQGGGSRFTWGKPGDEFLKKTPGQENDEEEIEAAQDKFTQEISAKLLQDRLATDELEPTQTLSVAKPELLKASVASPVHKSGAEEEQKTKADLLVKSRESIEIAYYSSKSVSVLK